MLRKYVKPLASLLVLVVTALAFAHFVSTHPAARHQLANVHPAVLLLLLGLYALVLGCLVLAQEGTLDMCATRLGRSETLLLTMYTAIVNFFGPLQSGPGFRAVYLKKKYGTKLKNYALATLLYLGFYAGFSGLFLLSGVIGWQWLLLLALLGACVIAVAVRLELPLVGRLKSLAWRGSVKLGVATLLQVSITAIIYYVELRSVNHAVHFSQAVIYTGAANFALFVSVTPAAIGFRESFLLFSQHLHHINTTTIVNASLIDRGVYVLFLGILVLAALGLHAKQRLQSSSTA
ncbi:MAG TPA: lysylphosphatidylglycerol synthase domain-containing protein [Patescibacteria group bacterium]|nr:lysylphosphatidylglycerol synthase domain-containing protein [Patescibacteria group bacterium]